MDLEEAIGSRWRIRPCSDQEWTDGGRELPKPRPAEAWRGLKKRRWIQGLDR